MNAPCIPAIPVRLSLRQKQLVALVRQAKSNKEIAYELGLAEGTVKEYLYHLFKKVNVENRTGLAMLDPGVYGG